MARPRRLGAVIGVPDDRWGEPGHAVVVLHEGYDAAPGDILAFLDGRLARYKVPRALVLTDSLLRAHPAVALTSEEEDQMSGGSPA